MRSPAIARTRLTRPRSLALASAVAATALAATTAVAGAVPSADAAARTTARTTAPASASARSAQPTTGTTISVRLPHCATCSLRMQTAYSDTDVWQSHWKQARNNVVTFHVTPRQAHGSVFQIKAPWADLYGYQPLVAFHYKKTRVGQLVSSRLAGSKHRGTACYVGGLGRTSLTVRTAPISGRTPPGDPATGIRAWVAHSQVKYGTYLYAFKGSVGTQEVVVCPR